MNAVKRWRWPLLNPVIAAILAFCGVAVDSLFADGNERSVIFTVFGEIGHDWSGLYFSPDGEAFEELTFARYTRGPRMSATIRNGRFPIHRRDLGEDGTLRYPVEAENLLDPASDEFLLFFLAESARTSEGGRGRFRVMAMDDGPIALPRDHLVFFNATGVRLFGALDAEELTLNPGQSRALDLRHLFGREVPVGLVVRSGDTFERVLVNRLRFSPDRRTVILLLPPRREGSFRIQAVRLSESTGGTTPRAAED